MLPFPSNLRQLLSEPSRKVPSRIMAEVKNRRVTMTKPIVGRVKASAYALPDSDFVYGIESKLDSEGAGAGEISS